MRTAFAALSSLTLLACSSSPTGGGGGAGATLIVDLTSDSSGADLADFSITATNSDGGAGTGTVHVFADYGSLNGSGNTEVDVKLDSKGSASGTLDCSTDPSDCVADKVKVTAVWEGLQSASGTGAGELPATVAAATTTGPGTVTSTTGHVAGTTAASTATATASGSGSTGSASAGSSTAATGTSSAGSSGATLSSSGGSNGSSSSSASSGSGSSGH